MPPLPAVPNTLRTRVLFTIGTKPTQGVRTFFTWTGTTPTTTVLQALSVGLYNHLVTNAIATLMGTHVTLQGVELTDLSSTMGATGDYSHATVGTRTGGALPAASAFVTSYEVARRYRGGHPRSYWPFGTSTDLTTDQTWVPTVPGTFASAIRTSFSTFVGETSLGCTISGHVNVSFYKGFHVVTNPLTGRARNVPLVRPTGPLVTPVVGLIGRDYVGSFRKRRSVS